MDLVELYVPSFSKCRSSEDFMMTLEYLCMWLFVSRNLLTPDIPIWNTFVGKALRH